MKRKPYPTDLSDEQWKLLEPLLPPPEHFGRKSSVDLREIFNALLYLLRSGCAWRLLPHEFPKWTTVYYSNPFQKTQIIGVLSELDRLLEESNAFYKSGK